MKENEVVAFLVGFVFAMFVALFLITAFQIAVPSTHYKANVCNSIRGEIHGDVCILNSRVAQIPPMR